MLELYVKDGCPYCQKQIEELGQEGLSCRLHNVSFTAIILWPAAARLTLIGGAWQVFFRRIALNTGV